MHEQDEEPAQLNVQAGWTIRDRDGDPIGPVLGADADRFLIEGEGSERLQLPTDVIVDGDPAEMDARIALDADELPDAATRIPGVGLTSGGSATGSDASDEVDMDFHRAAAERLSRYETDRG